MDGETGQKRIELYRDEYDAVILDLMLPKRDGISVCKHVREKALWCPYSCLQQKTPPRTKSPVWRAARIRLQLDIYIIAACNAKPYRIWGVGAHEHVAAKNGKRYMHHQIFFGLHNRRLIFLRGNFEKAVSAFGKIPSKTDL